MRSAGTARCPYVAKSVWSSVVDIAEIPNSVMKAGLLILSGGKSMRSDVATTPPTNSAETVATAVACGR